MATRTVSDEITFKEFFDRFLSIVVETKNILGITTLTLPQLKILWYLYWKGDLTTREIGHLLLRRVYRNLSARATSSRLHLDRLFKKGLLKKRRNGRINIWSLSEKALGIIEGKGGVGVQK